MATSTIDWLYIGSTSQINTDPLTPPTSTEAARLVGLSGEGQDLVPTKLTGTILRNGQSAVGGRTEWFLPTYYQHRTATWESWKDYPDSTFSYDDPGGDGVTTNQTMTGFYTVRIRIDYPDGRFSTHDAIAVQMSGGDVFIRPTLQLRNDLDGIAAIQKVTITSASAPSAGRQAYLDPTVGFRPSIYETRFVCFASGTLIETGRGPVAVEDLRVGDLVVTRDSGLQPIRWIGRRRLGVTALKRAPHLRPVRIRAGALGADLPRSDLLVSPQHRILVRSPIAQRMFCATEVLVPAKQLCEIDGFDIAADVAEVEYHHFMFDRHEVVFANGAEAESLYAGAEALKAVGPAARAEVLSIFPELAGVEDGFVPHQARMLISGRPARNLAARHVRNGKPLVERTQHPPRDGATAS